MYTEVSDNILVADQESLFKVLISPLKFLSLLLRSLFLSPTSAYSLIEVLEGALYMAEEVKPIMIWLIGYIKLSAPGVTHLGAICLEDQFTRGQREVWRDLVPENPEVFPQEQTYIPPPSPAPTQDKG